MCVYAYCASVVYFALVLAFAFLDSMHLRPWQNSSYDVEAEIVEVESDCVSCMKLKL